MAFKRAEKEFLNEPDTRAKLIDPALHRKGWTEDLIHREETACGIDIEDGKPRRRERGRIEYLLCGIQELENPHIFGISDTKKRVD
ncbi:MAG: hypothetical protein N2246_02495 [Candidatus Sumerlaeia bacterium]|nr:hypothetical protein [Candidatus Sumerlaeia bacterium]